jgi:hypothetical protein
LYVKLRNEGYDLHELHVLMAPRPFLVSGGSEDPLERWIPLNHSIAVNRLLGYTDRVAMSNRIDHSPDSASNAILGAFFSYYLDSDNTTQTMPTNNSDNTTTPKIIYDFSKDKNLNQWRLEGNGELKLSNEGALQINTFRVSGAQKATNVWLSDLILPDNFEIEIDFRSESENGNTMIIFNALPFGLNDLFDDPRIDAAYADLASKRKMQAYTVGFHRATYGNPSNLRKIGGRTPENWGDAPWPTPAWKEMDSITTLSSKTEPFTPADKGKIHHFKLQKNENHIRFWVNGELVHDYIDTLTYPYCDKVLMNGSMGFRNFGGPAEDFYTRIVIKEI